MVHFEYLRLILLCEYSRASWTNYVEGKGIKISMDEKDRRYQFVTVFEREITHPLGVFTHTRKLLILKELHASVEINCIIWDYLSIDYACNNISSIVYRIKPKPPDHIQQDIFQQNNYLLL